MAKQNKRKVSRSKKRRTSQSAGQVPGAVVYIGDKEHLETSLEVFDYSVDSCKFFETNAINEVFTFKGNDHISWINVNGLGHTAEISALGNYFKLHPLILEDIVNTDQRPKIDEYEHYLFIVLKMLYFNEAKEVVIEHVSMVLGEGYVITFQESEEDVFEVIRERLKNPKSRIRNSEADYLAFSILDAVVDNYFVVVDNIEEGVERMEDLIFLEGQKDSIPHDIQSLKQEILRIRRNVIPAREVISRIVKTESGLIQEKTVDYYRDLQDHILHISENIDVYREMTWGLMDMYQTTISNKMNSIMKVLTIIATIFIPLTFIAGIYGMNFDNMPELHYKYGYYILLGVMVLVFFALILYFRRKKWL
ncbi:MAG: magnesium/cobalt transporter CorA [Aureisphaera sp.]